MEVSGQFHVPAVLPSGEVLLYPLNRRLGGPQSWSGRDGWQKNPCPCRESKLGRPARSPVIVLTELHRPLTVVGPDNRQNILCPSSSNKTQLGYVHENVTRPPWTNSASVSFRFICYEQTWESFCVTSLITFITVNLRN